MKNHRAERKYFKYSAVAVVLFIILKSREKSISKLS